MAEREVIVTGAAGGVGAGIGAAFAAAGWRTIGLDRVEPAELSVWSEHVRLDLADPAAIEAFFASRPAREVHVRCIVNNAAVQVCRPVHETSLMEWEAVQAVNLRAPYLMMRHGLGWLRAAANGSIVNITSVHATATSPSIAAYAASKGGLEALTRAAALDLAPFGVRVNAIAPGAIDTPMLRDGLRRAGGDPDTAFATFSAAQAVGRVGVPAEIGALAVFLADPATGGFFTGASLRPDGGATARLSTE
jgi:NAD(P)-dependent dehydrogenase (short-subunit alcohol dehydrogenase family)